MALKYGTTTISSSYTVKYGTTALKILKYSTTEVWRREETIHPNGYTITQQKNGVQDGLTSVGAFYAQTSNSSGGAGRAYTAVNFTNWNTLTVVWSIEAGTYTYGFIGITKSVPVTADGYGWFLSVPIDKVKQQAFVEGGKVTKSNQTTTVNISSLSGTYYLLVNVYSGSSIDAYIRGSISSAILS